jgi:type I restriction enzyme R subunit
MPKVYESDLEKHILELLEQVGYFNCQGEKLDPDRDQAERTHYRQAILEGRFKKAIQTINPKIPLEACEEAVKKVIDVGVTELLQENRRLHQMCLQGVPVQYWQDDEIVNDRVQLVDWSNKKNEWLAVNQYTVIGNASKRRLDIVCFLNGLPIVVVELKGPEEQNANIEDAFQQIENYKNDVPELFRANVINVISDGHTARYGTISANFDRYMKWRTIDGEKIEPISSLAIETLVKGLLSPNILLELMRRFIVFEEAQSEGASVIKKAAGYHQFHAGKKGLSRVLEAVHTDKRVGVMWHTQGSGKSLLMAFFTGLLVHEHKLSNPTVVIITDRNDLDSQLFSTFSRCRELFGQDPEQATDVYDLRKRLDRHVGGVIFSTIQKFQPVKGSEEIRVLTTRSNVIVIVDEAHRTQYGFEAKIDPTTGKKTYGFAHYLRKSLPNASFVGFTGTPISLGDRNTEAVFGDLIDVYDVAQAVDDEATVPIYYEAKMVKLALDKQTELFIDKKFEELTGDIEDDERARLGTHWAKFESIVGASSRLDELAKLIVENFEDRSIALQGKAMIVCMSRRICVELYDRIIKLRKKWHSDRDDKGEIKVVMTGSSSDPEPYQPHVRNKTRLELLANRFRDSQDPFKLVIVRDMWLTGFDAPCMHTIYIDKPMKGHNLMQAIARVNRVFKGKPGGLVVDTIGIGVDLKQALNYYSDRDRANTGIDCKEAIDALLEKLDILRSMFHHFDYVQALGDGPGKRMQCISAAVDFVYCLEANDKQTSSEEQQKAGRKRFLDAAVNLSKAFKLAAGSIEADTHKEEVAFFLAVRIAILKMDNEGDRGCSTYDVDKAIEQLISRSVASTEVVDILKASGMERPDLSVLSEEFLKEIQGIKHKDLAAEALRRLLKDEIKSRTRTNISRQKQFSERLSEVLARYHNRVVDALQVIQELINIAKDLRDEPEDGLSSEEIALYEALADNKSAIEVMGNEQLRIIAAALVTEIREKSSVDWWRQDAKRKKIRIAVKHILKKYGFPPDLQDEAIKTVVEQAETLAAELSKSKSTFTHS